MNTKTNTEDISPATIEKTLEKMLGCLPSTVDNRCSRQIQYQRPLHNTHQVQVKRIHS